MQCCHNDLANYFKKKRILKKAWRGTSPAESYFFFHGRSACKMWLREGSANWHSKTMEITLWIVYHRRETLHDSLPNTIPPGKFHKFSSSRSRISYSFGSILNDCRLRARGVSPHHAYQHNPATGSTSKPVQEQHWAQWNVPLLFIVLGV